MLRATALAVIGGINIAGCLLAGCLGQCHLKNVLLGLTYLARSVVLLIYFSLPPTTVTTILFAAAMAMLWLGRYSASLGLCGRITKSFSTSPIRQLDSVRGRRAPAM
jgi:hypothetical protein